MIMSKCINLTEQSAMQLYSCPARVIGHFREADTGSLSSALVPYGNNSGTSPLDFRIPCSLGNIARDGKT